MLLDVMMPGMSGHEVQRIMRQHPLLRDVAVIFVTADTSPDSELQGAEAGGRGLHQQVDRGNRSCWRRSECAGAPPAARSWSCRCPVPSRACFTHGEQVNFNADWAVPLGYARAAK